jgi:hypothetical protein
MNSENGLWLTGHTKTPFVIKDRRSTGPIDNHYTRFKLAKCDASYSPYNKTSGNTKVTEECLIKWCEDED